MLIALVSFCFSFNALASPSGLNNIPTSDTASGSPVFQIYSSVGNAAQTQHITGIKWGGGVLGEDSKLLRFEIGADERYAPGSLGSPVAQFKVAFHPVAQGPDFALGRANWAFTDDSNPFDYLIASQTLGSWRFHGGYGLQTSANTFLFGLDKSFQFSGRDTLVRLDLVQVADGSGVMPSIGALHVLNSWAVAETWVSQSTLDASPWVMLKLNLIPQL